MITISNLEFTSDINLVSILNVLTKSRVVNISTTNDHTIHVIYYILTIKSSKISIMTKTPISDPMLRNLAETLRHRVANLLEGLRVERHISIRNLVPQLSIGDKTLQRV